MNEEPLKYDEELRQENDRLKKELEALIRHNRGVEELLAAINASRAFKVSRLASKVLREAKASPLELGRKAVRKTLRDPTWALRGVRGNKPVVAKLATSVSLSDVDYARWIARNEPSAATLEQQRIDAKALPKQPLISLITPVFNPPLDVLEDLIRSIQVQTYGNFELCLGNFSTKPEVQQLIDRFAKADSRIKTRAYATNDGIAGNSNVCLELSSGDYIGLLDHDDTLSPDALYENAVMINQVEYDFIYSDKDKIDRHGERFEPFFKPSWSPETLFSANYLTHFNVMKRSLIDDIGGWDSSTDGAQDWDLFYKITEHATHVGHIPKILYHWRVLETSTALSINTKPYALKAQRVALQNHLKRTNVIGESYHNGFGDLAVDWRTAPLPTTLIVLLSSNPEHLSDLLQAVTQETVTTPTTVVVLHSYELKSSDQLNYPSVKFASWTKGELARELNACLAKYTSETVIMLDDRIRLRQAGWLSELLGWYQIDGIAAVGGRVMDEYGLINDVGRIFNLATAFGNLFYGQNEISGGLLGYSTWSRNLIAVSERIFSLRRDQLANDPFNTDVRDDECVMDLFLQLHNQGKRLVYNPNISVVEHTYSIVRLPASQVMRQRIEASTELMKHGDVFYNANLSLDYLSPQLGDASESSRLNYQKGMTQSKDTGTAAEVDRYITEAKYFAHAIDITAEELAANAAIVSLTHPVTVKTAAWFIPGFTAIYAGYNNIFSYAEYLRREHGVINRFYIQNGLHHTRAEKRALSLQFPLLAEQSEFYTIEYDVQDVAPADIGICTLWTTAYLLAKFQSVKRKLYFIQDYEPAFYPEGSLSGLARASYDFGFWGLTNTEGLNRRYQAFGNTHSTLLKSVVDLKAYTTDAKPREAKQPYRIFFYARPGHPRNAFELALEALIKLKTELGTSVEIFGAGSDWSPAAYGVEGIIENLGKLPYDELPTFYQSLDAALVLMFSGHPGVIPSELMASGCPVVMNTNDDYTWNEMYKHEQTALISLPTASELARNLRRALEEPKLRATLIAGGRELTRTLYAGYGDEAESAYRFISGS